jgi:putative methyltransferase (TIGR04325 family)
MGTKLDAALRSGERILARKLRAARARLGRGRPDGNVYVGAYRTMQEAEAALPGDRLVGYDHDALAAFYRERLDRVQPEDYPVLFWLERAATPGMHVVDFGGHVGLHYYAFTSKVALPEGTMWTVCDVPAVAREGARIAEERGASRQLRFISDLRQLEGCDVLLASGSIHYLEPSFLPSALARMQSPPAHLLLNKTPLRDGPSFVTLQDNGLSVHPYVVLDRGALIGDLGALGYRVVDEWENPGFACRVELRRGLDVEAYSGLYLRRA